MFVSVCYLLFPTTSWRDNWQHVQTFEEQRETKYWSYLLLLRSGMLFCFCFLFVSFIQRLTFFHSVFPSRLTQICCSKNVWSEANIHNQIMLGTDNTDIIITVSSLGWQAGLGLVLGQDGKTLWIIISILLWWFESSRCYQENCIQHHGGHAERW